MLDILIRSVARAGGIEVPSNVRIIEPSPARPSILKRAADAFERWNVRRSTYLTLKQLDDRTLRDIGLHRDMLRDYAGDLTAANDNTAPAKAKYA